MRKKKKENAALEEAQTASLFFTATQIRKTIETLSEEYIEREEAFRLIEGPKGYFLAVSPSYANWVRLLRGELHPQKLSQAALETLALIAYRQPIMRAVIESVRGVSADNSLNRLMEHNLITAAGRAASPGRPMQYCTTEYFLEYCGIESLEELPASDVIAAHQFDTFIEKATQPEIHFKDSDMGLPEEKKE